MKLTGRLRVPQLIGRSLARRAMARFRVTMKGGPVFLRDEESGAVGRFGFFTTRWVRASSPEVAGVLACQMVTGELATTGTLNPRDQPATARVESVDLLTWMESLRQLSAGGGFTFFPDEPN
jgi:hypothetical protein